MKNNRMHISTKKLRLALVAVLFLWQAAPTWAQCERLAWQDEFNGPNIDLSKWELEVNGTGQGTGQLDYATARPQNASIVNGNLELNILKEEYGGLHYTSARLRTYKKIDFQYGRIEARVKGVYSQGNGFAFWMLGSDFETIAWPKCGEVDIFENTGRLPGHNIGTAHYQEAYGHASNQGSVDLPAGQRWADGFHVTGIEWSPTHITWTMDGVPYHTMDLTNPINGYRPFSRPFFLLLSVGMGGDYSGPPDATTVNPMTATIDWVHVYKGTYSTFVSGDDKVYKGEQGKQYTVSTNDDGTYQYSWTVPAGATIVSGQGTATVTVDWGQTPGAISAQVTSSCNTNSYSLNVGMEEPLVVDKVFENFETPPAFTYTTISGTLLKGVANPLVNSVNSSAKVGKYLRNDGALYDVIGMSGVNATPAGDFVIGKRRILMDVYTDAAPGTKVSLNFENSTVANAGNYPSGRYANFEAVTSRRNQWETLEFVCTGTPDAGTGGSSVDQWILLFAPVTNTGNVFYYDNLRTGQPGGPARVLDTRVLQNFDGTDLLTKDFANGVYTVQANPSAVAPNTSATVVKYVRDGGTSYDALVYKTLALTDGRPFRLGTSTVLVDVYSDAPVGTKLSLNFEVSSVATPTNYPQGRYANFEAVTTKQNQWETIVFALSSIPDQGASDAAVDKLVFLLNPVTLTNNTYYLDNIRVNSTTPKEILVPANVWEDYDANDNLTLNSTTGTYTPKTANPSVSGINTSANVAQYVRSATTQYDLLVFNKGTAALNPTALKTRTQKIAIDVYTTAPAGTPITVGLDASSIATATNYPNGRHSNYQGVTTVQNAWHTVYFTFGAQPDASTPDNLVDHIALLFKPGALTGETFYIDNFRVLNVTQQATLTTIALTPALSQNVAIGGKVQFTGQGKDQTGTTFATPIAWSVSGGGTIDASGLFTTSTNGAFKVYAKSNGVTASADVLVGQAVALTTIKVDPISTFAYQGTTLQLTARGTDQTGAPAAFTPTWTTSGASGVTVSTTGLLTVSGTASGMASVVASSGALSSTATIQVRATPVADSIAMGPAKVKVYQGDAQAFYAKTFDQYRNPFAATYTWSVSGGGSIDATGQFTSTTIGSFVVKVQAGTTVTSTYVSVVPKPANLALNKPVRASSVQNSALGPFYVTDGITVRTNPDTRWSSVGPTTDANGVIIKDDPQWVRIDLGQKYDLSRVVLYWEAAYGKVYDIQVADDTVQTRRVAYHEAAGDGNVDDLTLVAGSSGRYVWMYGTGRGTPYGYSLYEMQVYGMTHQNPVLTSIIVTPNFSTVATGKNTPFTATSLDQFGNVFATTPTWTATGGTISSTGVFSATTAGTYTSTAASAGVTGSASITVQAANTPVLTSIAVTPTTTSMTTGTTQQFTAQLKDQFGNAFTATPNWTVSGGSSISASGLFTANTVGGPFTVTATSGSVNGTASISVTAANVSPNLALNKPVRASSIENYGTPAVNAVDGNGGTRWASASTDAQWLRVDLGATYTVNEVKLIWEAAYGKDYVVEISADTVNWTPLKTVTGNTALVNDWIGLSGTGRYVRMNGKLRGTGYGYSLWEMEVYGAAATINPVLTSIAVTPATASIASGATQQFTAQGKDQNGNAFTTTPTWAVSGGGSISASGLFTANTVGGPFTVAATSGTIKGTASISVTSSVAANLALNKRVRASSVENYGTPAVNAVDGNGGTRWSSAAADPQWIRVDLGATYSVNRVKLTWENAYGKDFLVQVSADTVNWTTLKTVVGNTVLVNDLTGLTGSGRYVRMYGTARGTGYGYSLWELEVYGAVARGALAASASTTPGSSLAVFPNPVTNTASLTGLGLLPTMVVVYDDKGASVLRVQLAQPAETTVLDVSALQSGLYFIRATNGAGVQTQRFVKE